MKVFPPLLANPAMEPEVETLHHLAVGAHNCAACGASKFAQKFYYTDDFSFFDLYARQASRVGMWSPKWEMITPFRACTPAPQPTPLDKPFLMSNGTTVLQ